MFHQWQLCVVFALVLLSFQETSAQRYGKYSSIQKDISSKDQTSRPQVTKGYGISAWGLVFLVLSLILLGVSAYYFMIFYPILCKKERKYDRIELATV